MLEFSLFSARPRQTLGVLGEIDDKINRSDSIRSPQNVEDYPWCFFTDLSRS